MNQDIQRPYLYIGNIYEGLWLEDLNSHNCNRWLGFYISISKVYTRKQVFIAYVLFSAYLIGKLAALV